MAGMSEISRNNCVLNRAREFKLTGNRTHPCCERKLSTRISLLRLISKAD